MAERATNTQQTSTMDRATTFTQVKLPLTISRNTSNDLAILPRPFTARDKADSKLAVVLAAQSGRLGRTKSWRPSKPWSVRLEHAMRDTAESRRRRVAVMMPSSKRMPLSWHAEFFWKAEIALQCHKVHPRWPCCATARSHPSKDGKMREFPPPLLG